MVLKNDRKAKGTGAITAPARHTRCIWICFPLGLAILAWLWLSEFRPLQYWVVQSNTPNPHPIVKIHQGSILGTVINHPDYPVPVEAFLGIPYAQPPLGRLRFSRPVPVDHFDGVLEAVTYGPRCPGKQLLSLGNGPDHYSEDCLTLNIFRQAGTNDQTDKKVPVAVYIHGGAFNRGTARMHDTASMVAWSSEPFIAVSFNYRLGALGFLNSKTTAKARILNVGLHDQITVLKWVKANIAAIGGDPDNVTIIGLSAGAHSIGHHILNVNLGDKLFHKAVMESGGPTSRALHPYDSGLHEEQFQKLLAATGCAHTFDEEAIDCLREVSSDDIISASGKVFSEWNPSVRWAWQPVIDGEIISRRPIDALQSGDWNHVPILTGFNHNEGTMYVPKGISHSNDFKEFFSTLLPQLSPSDLQKIVDLYPDPASQPNSPYRDTRGLQVGPQFKRTEAAYGQYAYVCPARQTAQLAVANLPQRAGSSVYLYHWATNTTVLGGANHGDQLPYETMNPQIRSVSPSQNQIAAYFHAYITSFILTGNPNAIRGGAPNRPEWFPYKNTGLTEDYGTMVFGEGNDERAGGKERGTAARYKMDNWAKKECAFWQSKSVSYED